MLDQRKTILVIEDDPFVRRATCELLADASHDVIDAENATTAQGLFARNSARINAVICDAVLPDASGLELCRVLQREEPELCIILTSGYPVSGTLDRGSRCSFLEKPYSGYTLLATVKSIVTNKLDVPDALLPGAIADHVQNLRG